MTRFFSPLSRSSNCRFRGLVCTAALLGLALSAQTVRADEFSLVPLGDPIYSQLSGLTRSRSNKKEPREAKTGTLTRYEAALQAARAILDVQNRDVKTVTKANWRAIKGLCGSLKSELKQLGVDVDVTLALAERNLRTADSPAPASASISASPAASVALGALASPAASVALSKTSLSAAGAFAPGLSASGRGLLASASAGPPSAGLMLGAPSLASRGVKTSTIEIPILSRLRSETSLLGSQDAVSVAPTGNAAALDAALSPQELAAISAKNGLSATLGSQTSLALDFGAYLTFRAATSQRRLGVAGDDSSLLLGPLFDGATRSRTSGGGLDAKLGSLKISTDIEKLSTDTGAGASRFGGGASLSALQNKLFLGMNLSRLVPENPAILPSTAAQLNLGLDVTQRLRLKLLYQGLFAQAAQNSASRVSGGVSLSF